MPIKYGMDQSGGVPFDLNETRSVVVTDELIVPNSGYVGDAFQYTATVKDNTGAALPDTFVMSLLFDFVGIKPNFVLDASVYDPVTFLLTLNESVPGGTPGSKNVWLQWVEQII